MRASLANRSALYSSALFLLDHTPAGHQLPESSAATCVPCNPCCHHRQAVNLPAQLRSTPALNTPHTARWLRAISGEACLKKSVTSARASQAHCVPSFLCSKCDLTLPANLPRNEPQRRACSSVGRASALQAGGRRFEPGHVHQPCRSPISRVATRLCRCDPLMAVRSCWRSARDKTGSKHGLITQASASKTPDGSVNAPRRGGPTCCQEGCA